MRAVYLGSRRDKFINYSIHYIIYIIMMNIPIYCNSLLNLTYCVNAFFNTDGECFNWFETYVMFSNMFVLCTNI